MVKYLSLLFFVPIKGISIVMLLGLCFCIGMGISCKSPDKNDHEQVAYRLMNMLNGHHADSLNNMLAEDIRFQDAQNRVLEGKARISQGWDKYWELFPDYHITIEDVFVEGDKIAVFGITVATYKNKQTESNENQWTIPVAWQLTVKDGKITYWKMYGDTKIIYEIIRSNEEGEE